MTQYVYIPSEAPTEAAWPATTERWGTSYYTTAVTADRATPVQDRAYKASQPTTTSAFWIASFDGLDGDANRATVEVLTCWRDDDTGGAGWQSDFGVVVRASGAAGAEVGYYFGGRVTNNVVRIGRFNGAGSYVAIGADAAKTLANNTWYWQRSSASGSTLKVKVWADGSTEPTAWDKTETEATISAAGWIGLEYGRGGAIGSGRFAFISVGTNGDAAPTPLSRTAWRAWLVADGVERTVLAEVGMMDTATPVTRYLSNRPFASRSYDSPASQVYTTAIIEAPNWSQTATELFAGQTSIAISELRIANDSGARDAWLKANVDGRDVRLLLGASTWPRYDFRPLAVAVSEYVRTDGTGAIALVLRDKQRLADRAVSEDVITSGDNADRLIPVLIGTAYWMDPVSIDNATLEYQIHNGTIVGFGHVYDNGVLLASSTTISSVNAGTDTITTTAAHGWLPGYEINFLTTAGNVVAGTSYYAITGTTGSALKISDTRGGALKDLNGSETGTVWGYGRAVDKTSGKFWLATTPAGEVRVETAYTELDAGPGLTDPGSVPSVMKEVLSNYCGLAGSLDDATFDTTATYATEDYAGIYLTDRVNAVDVLDLFAKDRDAAWGVSRDGLFYMAPLDGLVYQTFTFGVAEIIGGLTLERTLMPISSARVRDVRNSNPSTQFASSVSTVERLRRAASHYLESLYNVTNGTDSQANHALAVREAVIDSYSNGSGIFSRHQENFQRKAAIWSFETTLKALECRVGDRATITYPRYGFDAGLTGTIIAVRDNLAAQRVRLSVLVQNYSQAAAPS